MTSEIFEEIVEQRKDCINSDRVYLDNDNYFELLKDDNFMRASGDIECARVAGMEVQQVPYVDGGVMVLDSSEYPTADDFKSGRTQAIPLRFYSFNE